MTCSLASLARATPAGLARLNDGTRFAFPPHLRALDDALLDVAAGRCDRLLVMMPPRHGKSQLCARAFPAWYVMRFAERRIVLASHEHDFAATWAWQAREIAMRYAEEVFGCSLVYGSQARDRWRLTNGSEMYATGVGGSLTGRGADVLIIDDPVKNATEALSKTYRERAWDWYTSTALTRLEPGGAVVLIMTRWHEDDLAGRVLESEPGRWRIIRFPAIAERDDMLGREPGQALWPERFDEGALAAVREAIGEHWWAAMYQQRPAPREGYIVKAEWWRHWTELPDAFVEVVQSWDLAFTGSSSYVVGQVWAWDGRRAYLLDQERGHWDFPATLVAIKRLSERWPQARTKLIEETANAHAAMAMLQKDIGGFVPVRPTGSKEARARAVSAAIERGDVLIPDDKRAPWVREYVAEWTVFPLGANDDQVDATTQALTRWLGDGRISIGWIAR